MARDSIIVVATTLLLIDVAAALAPCGGSFAAQQWSMFTEHQAGLWEGVLTTYDAQTSAVEDEVFLDVDMALSTEPSASLALSHVYYPGEERADCRTRVDRTGRFDGSVGRIDTVATRKMALGVLTPGRLGRHVACGPGYVHGPGVLRSGAVSTELAVCWHGAGRVRATFQHAPVWPAGAAPGSGPPAALELRRVVVAREVVARQGLRLQLNRCSLEKEAMF